jgi:tRNA pseudouridine38-40 synthase
MFTYSGSTGIDGVLFSINAIFRLPLPVVFRKDSIVRYFIDLAYKGTAYHGWQIQPNAVSVQEVLEKNLSLILRKPTEVTASGRTDAGVHATTQVVHLDHDEELTMRKHGHKLNAVLPDDIAIKNIRQVSEAAHARFSAVSRSYEYYITPWKDPFAKGMSYLFTRNLDLDRMNDAAGFLLGQQDFQCFSKVKTDVHTYICEISRAEWREVNGNLVFYVSANRFLRGMVRAIVGTLIEIGSGNAEPAEMRDVIASEDRGRAGRAVPPEGLFLTAVDYPAGIYLDRD